MKENTPKVLSINDTDLLNQTISRLEGLSYILWALTIGGDEVPRYRSMFDLIGDIVEKIRDDLKSLQD